MGLAQEKSFIYVEYHRRQTAKGITVSQDRFAAEKVVLFNITADRKKEPEGQIDREGGREKDCKYKKWL